MVIARPAVASEAYPSIIASCDQVTATPDNNNNIVFNRGISNG